MKETLKWVGAVLGGLAVSALVVWIAWTGENANDQRRAVLREAWLRNPLNPVNICIAQGGVPIIDNWSGGLATCQFRDGSTLPTVSVEVKP